LESLAVTFRGHRAAASLKHDADGWAGRLADAFRGHRAAASLKLSRFVGDVAEDLDLPRPSRRGLVEAWTVCLYWARRSAAFRGHRAAASLKQ